MKLCKEMSFDRSYFNKLQMSTSYYISAWN